MDASFSYLEILDEELTALDLRADAENLTQLRRDHQAYRIAIGEYVERANALYVPELDMIGIAWGADACWVTGISDPATGITLWLNGDDETDESEGEENA
jgi:hypothetical protein